SLITVESDKASMEIPSSHAGVVQELRARLGDRISQGSLLLLLHEAGAANGVDVTPSTEAAVAASIPVCATPDASASSSMEPAAPDTTTPAREIVSAAGQRAHASPSIRKLARELGVGLEQVSG